MDRSTRYHNREYEKALTVVKEGGAQDARENRAMVDDLVDPLEASEKVAAAYKHVSEVQNMTIGDRMSLSRMCTSPSFSAFIYWRI